MNDLVIPPAVQALTLARAAGRDWAVRPLRERLATIGRARRLIAREAAALAAMVRRPPAVTLVAEVLPLAEAARFLCRAAPRLLAPRRLRAGRPAWLFGVTAEVLREPYGCVLILAPSNYPLLLAGVQAMQALAAGNAVCVKPAPGCADPMLALAGLLRRAGLPDGVLQILDADAGPDAVRAGFDRIVLTGSAETGQRVLQAAAAALTPTTMELSGVDAVFVLPGADPGLVASCLGYGLRLNGGATCIAPRRVYVTPAMAAPLEAALLALLPGIPPADVPAGVAARLDALVAAAPGVRVLSRNPTVIADADSGLDLLRHDVFAPWLALVPVADMEVALAADALCPYALGASIFGPAAEARRFADRVDAGSVCINDLIVPTADPRLPFGGRKRSGFGVTRGAEGLLEMTVVKTVSLRHRFRPHLAPPTPADADRFAALTALLHGGWADRWAALQRMARLR